jgi:2-polyprenyl-3-methyl-5-hydroxy-6-metoxy-1,4-benzoquinol methylase
MNKTKNIKTIDYRERIYRKYARERRNNRIHVSSVAFNARAPMYSKIIREHFPLEKSAAVLDLGCGDGAFIYCMSKAGYNNVRGVDRSPEQVDMAKRVGVDAVIEGDLFNTLESLPDGSQDVVVAFDVIEHFTKAEVLSFSDEVLRVLRPSGRWIIHTPNGESPFVGATRYGDFTHELAFTRGSLNQVLQASGFEQIEYFEDRPIVHGVRSCVRLIMWLFFRSIIRLVIMVETGDKGINIILTQNFLTIAHKKAKENSK